MTSQITNEEAIKGLKKLRSFHNGSYGEYIDMAIKTLEQQTCIEDYPTCTECEHYDREKHYCPRFCQVIKDTLAEAQPSEPRTNLAETSQDCISRQAVIGLIGGDYGKWLPYAIMELPSVTPQRPNGKWIDVHVIKAFHYDGEPRVRCSCCGNEEEWSSNYCPNCGAEMGGGGEE